MGRGLSELQNKTLLAAYGSTVEWPKPGEELAEHAILVHRTHFYGDNDKSIDFLDRVLFGHETLSRGGRCKSGEEPLSNSQRASMSRTIRRLVERGLVVKRRKGAIAGMHPFVQLTEAGIKAAESQNGNG